MQPLTRNPVCAAADEGFNLGVTVLMRHVEIITITLAWLALPLMAVAADTQPKTIVGMRNPEAAVVGLGSTYISRKSVIVINMAMATS